jgi:uncharacterized protein (DUF2345 family)
MALLRQAMTLADSFSQAAKTHQTTSLATAVGTIKTNASGLSDKLAPMKALHQAASGMVSQAAFDSAVSDAGSKSTQAQNGRLPHTTDPIVAITAKAGLATVAGQDIQFASGEAISWQAGQDLHIASGNQLRVNTGQSLGILAGAVQAGNGAKGKGLTMIAGQGPVQMQAQAGQAQVAAKGLINVQSANSHIDWAAAKKITLATSGGASIVIDGNGITTQCPGKITVRAAQKSFIGPGSESYQLPRLPRVPITDVPVKFDLRLQDVPGPHGIELAETDWRVVSAPNESAALSVTDIVMSGTSDSSGQMQLTEDQHNQLLDAYNQHPMGMWVVFDGHVRELALIKERDSWTDQQRLYNALDAMGYAHDYDVTGEAGVDEFHAKQARRDLKTNAPGDMFSKLKGGQ